MGYNTTVVVMNDALSDIKNDPEFGKKLVEAIHEASLYRPTEKDDRGFHKIVDVSAGHHANAAHVVETHHADGVVLIAVGGNLGQVVDPHVGGWTIISKAEEILKHFADRLGYVIYKKPTNKKGGK